MSRMVVLLLTYLVVQVSWVPAAATTYKIEAYFNEESCDGTPYEVIAKEDSSCSDQTCSTVRTSPDRSDVDIVVVTCATDDYISEMRKSFANSDYVLKADFEDSDCSSLNEAYGYPATGNCEGPDKASASSKKTFLYYDGSALIEYFEDATCSDDYLSAFPPSADNETMTSHSCDTRWFEWYSSNDIVISESGSGGSGSHSTSSSTDGNFGIDTISSASSSSDNGNDFVIDTSVSSSSSSTKGEVTTGFTAGAVVGITSAAFVVLLVIIGVVVSCRRRSSWKPAGQQTATFPSNSPEGAIGGQTGLWNDNIITARRIPRDKVQMKKLIRRGAYGEVYHGVFNGQQVAVKVLPPATRTNLQHVTQFLAEAKMTASMDHPHIVTFVGVAWDSLSDVCVVLEFMDGGDLRSLLDKYQATKHPVGVDREKATIALHVCHALTYLHSLMPSVIHRDLKSRNILLNQAMEAKLTDFGVSKERLNQTMTVGVGTSLWMAPEVMLGEQYDVKADMFSFGVVLSELDVHTLPYEQAKQQSRASSGREMAHAMLMQKVSTGAMRVDFSDSSPQSLVDLGMACVSLEPKDRPSAAEALYRLQTILSQEF